MLERKVDLALVGVGHCAGHQLNGLRHAEGINLAAVCDRNESKLQQFSSTPSYQNVDAMLAETNAEGVIVSVPNDEHYTVASKVLQSGRHALVEKPVVQEMDKFDDLLDQADHNDVMMYSLFHAAFARDLDWWLDHGEDVDDLDRIVRFTAGFYDPYIDADGATADAETLQGSWIDSGINELSVACRLFHDIEFNSILYDNDHDYPCGEIQARAYFTAGEDQTVQLELDTNWTINLNRKMSYLTYDSGDEIILDHSGQRVIHRHADGDYEKLADFSDQHERLTAHYIENFRDFLQHYNDGHDNREYSKTCHELHSTAAHHIQ